MGKGKGFHLLLNSALPMHVFSRSGKLSQEIAKLDAITFTQWEVGWGMVVNVGLWVAGWGGGNLFRIVLLRRE